METHFDACNENNRCREIGKHGKAGSHVIWLIADKALYQLHPHIGCPEHKVMDIQPQNIQKIRKNQFPVFSEILQHRPVAVTVFDKIPPDQGVFQCCRHKKSNRQGK